MPSVRSVALGFSIGVGSRNETPEQAGISHFLEHLLFKGTNRFSSVEIDQIIGRAEVISDVPVPEIAAYHDSSYIGRNVVVAAAGNLEHDRLVALVEQACGDARDGTSEGLDPAPDSVRPRASFHQKTTEQY